MNRAFSIATIALTGALVGACAIRAQDPSHRPAQGPSPLTTHTSAAGEKPPKPQPSVPSGERTTPRLTADQAYKANCTRCHSELPKLDVRAMHTVLMHMRVRANIPEDEARGILAYLTR